LGNRFLQLGSDVKRLAREAGFDLAGVAGVAETPEHRFFPQWLRAGHAGEMQYLQARNDAGELKRASLANAAPWARSVVVCALNYNSEAPYSTHAGSASQGWISRYAFTRRDYHNVVLTKLRSFEAGFLQLLKDSRQETPRTWCYVDTGPVIERIFAQYAGIGWIGKNTCILNQRLGSWLFLGVMLTSLELTPDLPAGDRCGSCTRCLDACPTNAFPAPYQLDATRCISYLTIEKRGGIPLALREGIGRQVYGCDICQDVCPWNRAAPGSLSSELAPRPQLVNPALDWLARLSLEEFREAFRGSPVKRAKYHGLRRNVAVAMGNSGDPRFLPHLRAMAEDKDDTIAEHARWALGRLNTSQSDVTKTEPSLEPNDSTAIVLVPTFASGSESPRLEPVPMPMNQALSKRLRQASFSSPVQEAALSLLLAANRLNESVEVVCAGHGITRPQYNVLRILRNVYPEGHPRCEIASRMLERAPDVTRLIDRLQSRGLVRRDRAQHDQRQSIACITPEGLTVLDAMQPSMDALVAECFRLLNERDCDELSRICALIFAADEPA
jgi:epoxyqueuosine reductase